jgi:hypothetical protein
LATPDDVLDHFSYSKDYHSILLKDEEGVSLERISISEPTEEQHNWQSASSTSGHATPGYQNSISRPDFASKAIITVEPEIFEPLIGQPSFAQIIYNLEKPGMLANVNILDQHGRVIKEIANNELLGTAGFLRWDGDTEDGTKARSGYYIVWVELFDIDGNVFTYRKRVVIASGS